MAKILIVDDEEDILDLLEYNLLREGYEVIREMDGMAAVAAVINHKPDIVLLDIMMPKVDGIETCRQIRTNKNSHQPFIIFLTARAEEYSELAGFEAGADDYISKPIKPRILISRIRAVEKRGADENKPKVEFRLVQGDLEIFREEFMVYKKGKPITLPKKEFELLFFLATRPGKVFTRDVLLEKVWGDNVQVVDRTVDVHIRKIREKLGPKYIATIKGVGYKFIQQNSNEH
jgi:two-component system, OmpR family, alkaline phosphatase synthesis response regulator PhoP